MLTLFIVIMTVLKLSRVFINNDKFVFYKEFYNLLFIIYILLLYYLLLGTENASSGMNFTPFKEITRYSIGSKAFFYNVIGNIVLFIPFGYFVSDYLKAKKTHQILISSIIIRSVFIGGILNFCKIKLNDINICVIIHILINILIFCK